MNELFSLLPVFVVAGLLLAALVIVFMCLTAVCCHIARELAALWRASRTGGSHED